MPPAVIAAGVAAAGGITAGILSSRASNQAGQRQQQSTQQALDYQKQKDAQDRADKERDRALAKAAWDAEQARQAPRRAAIAGLLRARGINVPDWSPPPYNPDAPAGTPNAPTGGAGSSSSSSPMDLASFYGAPYGGETQLSPGAQAPTADATIADFFRRRQENL